MSRNSQYQFVSTDTKKLEAALIAAYEKITKTTVRPASPEKLFIQWVTNIIIQERVLTNYTGNQNIPSRAEGENLDALSELFYVTTRPDAEPAVCTVRFYISEAQNTAILVPAGTRVTDASRTLFWETTEDAYVAIGETHVDVRVRCQTPGTIGNDYAAGQLNTIVDVYDYYSGCENITASDSGSDRLDDDAFYELMRASMDGYSTAGPTGGYIYHAKRVSSEIADVVTNAPAPCYVRIYVLMNDGTIAGEELKIAVEEACSQDKVRPQTDYVKAKDPAAVPYDIDLTYYLPSHSNVSAATFEAAVADAVERYKVWQGTKLGRDINPSKLYEFLMATGIKRVEIRKPVFTKLRDGKLPLGVIYDLDDPTTVPQVATIGNTSIVNGGYEDE